MGKHKESKKRKPSKGKWKMSNLGCEREFEIIETKQDYNVSKQMLDWVDSIIIDDFVAQLDDYTENDLLDDLEALNLDKDPNYLADPVDFITEKLAIIELVEDEAESIMKKNIKKLENFKF